jgi:hypothetical protein
MNFSDKHSIKSGGRGVGGHLCLPKLSITALLSVREGKNDFDVGSEKTALFTQNPSSMQ